MMTFAFFVFGGPAPRGPAFPPRMAFLGLGPEEASGAALVLAVLALVAVFLVALFGRTQGPRAGAQPLGPRGASRPRPGAGPTGAPGGPAEALYRVAMDRLRRQGAATAKPLLQQALDRDPDHVGSLIQLGEILREEGEAEEAIRLHDRARGLEPESLEALLQLGADYERAGRPDEAVATLLRIRERFPEHRWAAERLRDLYAAAGQFAEAFEVQRDLLRARGITDPRDPEHQAWVALRYRLGRQKLEAGMAREAIDALREAIRLDRGFVPAYAALGEAYIRHGSPHRAKRIWERAYALTRSGHLLTRLEQLHLQQEHPDRLIEFYRDAVLQWPGDLQLRFRLGKLLLRLEMLAEAEAQIGVVTREAPEFAPAWVAVADLAERRGDMAQALAAARRALELAGGTDQEYRCQACGAPATAWADRCVRCGRWNALVDAVVRPPEGAEPPTVPSPIEILEA